MKLNYFAKRSSVVGKWVATAVFSVVAVVLLWQSPIFMDTAALASPSTSLMTTHASNQAQGAAEDVRRGSKEIIQDAKDKVKDAARSNSRKVDRADVDGGVSERKAMRDRGRIEERAENHADRTEKAVDDSMNAVQGAIENIKDVFRD
jgi:uncharacterized protein YjbJ (UPF0337 family)